MYLFIGVILPLITSTIFGASIYAKASLPSSKSNTANLAFGFFIGISSLIVLSRILSQITHSYRLAVMLSIFLQISYVIYSGLLNFKTFNDWRFLATNFLYLTIIYLLTTLFWLRNLNDVNQPMGSVGTLHSFRYAWISNLVSKCDNFPVLGQNTGQASLTAISNTLSGHQSPYLYLSLWLSVSIFMLYILVKEMLALVGIRKPVSNFAAFIFITLGSALSITYVLVIDSGYPVYLNGYTDTMLGIGNFLVISYYISKKIIYKINSMDSTILVFLLFNCFFVAPQNLLAVLIFVFFVFTFCVIKAPTLIQNPFRKILLFIVPTMAAIPLGGFLTPKGMLSKVAIPSINQTNKFTLDLIPGFPFNIMSPSSNIQESEKLVSNLKNLIDVNGYKSNETIWFIENLLLTNLRILFFPFLGVVLFYILVNSSQANILKPHKNSYESPTKIFFLAGGCSVITLLTIPTMLKISDFKWELNRLSFPIVIIGSLVVSIVISNQIIGKTKYRLIAWVAYTFSSIGPFLFFVIISLENFIRLYSKSDFSVYLGAGPVIFESECSLYR